LKSNIVEVETGCPITINHGAFVVVFEPRSVKVGKTSSPPSCLRTGVSSKYGLAMEISIKNISLNPGRYLTPVILKWVDLWCIA
jgi:hypothetical protein